MRALLITLEGVKEVELDDTDHLKGMYELIGCDAVDGAGYPNATHAAWVDDEGLFKVKDGTQVNLVSWYPQELAGKILVTGFRREDGETVEATMSSQELRSMVKIGKVLDDA